jgi:hypothetical protein
MLIKINRQTCLEKYPKFPLRWYNESTEEIEDTFPQVVSSFILTLPSKTVKGHSKLIGISYPSDGKCYERFSQSGAIKGRQIKL